MLQRSINLQNIVCQIFHENLGELIYTFFKVTHTVSLAVEAAHCALCSLIVENLH